MCGIDVMIAQHGWGEGNRRVGPATPGTWPCMPIKTRPQWHWTKSVNDAADPCGCWSIGGVAAIFAAATLRWLNRTQMWQMSVAEAVAGGRRCSVSCFTVSMVTLSTVSRQPAQTLTALRFRISYGYFHIRILGPKFDIRISRYQQPYCLCQFYFTSVLLLTCIIFANTQVQR